MYCPNCGKEIETNSNFCKYCGNQITPNNQDMPKKAIEYEYYVVESLASEDSYFDEVKAYGAAELNRDGLRESEALLHFWQKYQADVFPMIQEALDDGWQPLTEIGPACVRLRHSSQRKKKGFLESLVGGIRQYWEFTGVYVKFRRPKKT